MIHERVDAAGAMMAYITASAAGAKNHKLSDYIPTWNGKTSDPVDEMVEALKGLATRNRGNAPIKGGD